MEPQIVESTGVFQFRWRNRFSRWNGCPALALGKMRVDLLEQRARQIMLGQPAPLTQPSGSGPVWTRHQAFTTTAHPRPGWLPASQPNGVLPRPPNSRTLPQADLRNHTMCRALSARARSGLAAIADPALGVLPVAVVSACATPDNEPSVAAFPPSSSRHRSAFLWPSRLRRWHRGRFCRSTPQANCPAPFRCRKRLSLMRAKAISANSCRSLAHWPSG